MEPNNDSKIDFQTFVFASAEIVRALLLGESIDRLYRLTSNQSNTNDIVVVLV